MLAVVAVLLCVACKPADGQSVAEAQAGARDYPVQPRPPVAPLPPGEEWIVPPVRIGRSQAAVMAEPLQPSPENVAAMEMTPEDIRKWEAGARFNRGEAVDMDGNGKPDHFGSWSTGRFTYTVDENEDGRPDETFDGTTRTADTDLDGRANLVETRTVRANGGLKEVRESDTDSDGVMDERYTIEQLAPSKRHRRLERLKDGKWTVEYDVVGSPVDTMQKTQGSDLTDEQGTCQNRLAYRFPQNIDEPTFGSQAVRIPYSGPRRCSLGQANKVIRALRCVERKTDTCLPMLNPDVARQVRWLVRSAMPQAVVSCTGTCPNIRGGTWRGMDFGGGEVLTAIELPTSIESDSDDAACETLFHELMHAAGVQQGPNHDATGDDVIYSCSRVCTHCSHSSLGAGDDHKDCATCADANRKNQCGIKGEVTERILPFDGAYACAKFGAGAVTYAPCERRHEVLYSSCDDTKIRSDACCEGCPEGYSPLGGGLCNTLVPPNTCTGPLWVCGV